ncbi:MAG TPA: M1 family peptidase, partial [Gemmatimonadaceae bacterium]|nr:M1 family peptidase [Gemmatimonadaceae bacterium]
MTRRSIIAVLSVLACAPQTAPTPVTVSVSGPASAEGLERRAVRRDLPMTNTIRRALAAGTRDSTGRPGRNYWQLWTEYTINARLDAPSSTVTGRETVVLHNNSDTTLRNIVLRLDQNYFTPNAARSEPNPSAIEITSGMKLSRIAVDGQAASLPRGTTAGAGNGTAGGPTVAGLDQTVAVVGLPTPIAANGSATLEIDWSFKVPGVEGVRGQRMGRYGDTLYQVAQWYPRVAVFDDLRGWDTEPYLGQSEFYNNFGKWDVSIDVP